MASLPAFRKDQLDQLQKINERLHLDKKLGTSPLPLNKVVFVYTPAKVGSTALVTSLRLFANECLFVCHVHDETKFGPLQEEGVSVMDLVHYNRWLGREVYLIDIFRTPVERKMSDFFEKVASFHFNTNENQFTSENYPIEKLRRRFHQVFPHIAEEDYFRERFGIPAHLLPDCFPTDTASPYLFVDATETTGVRYIKLRLQDSEKWGSFLPSLLGLPSNIDFHICKDYETQQKPILGRLYEEFKENYHLPSVLFSLSVESSTSLSYYCSPKEREAYLQTWRDRLDTSSTNPTPFTRDQYLLYNEILRDNKVDYQNIQQRNHYLDNGCSCSLCHVKRLDLRERRRYGATLTVQDHIVHEHVQKEANVHFSQAVQRRLEAVSNKKRTATARWSLAANREAATRTAPIQHPRVATHVPPPIRNILRTAASSAPVPNPPVPRARNRASSSRRRHRGISSFRNLSQHML